VTEFEVHTKGTDMPASEVPRKTYLSATDETESGPEEGEGRILASTQDEGAVEEPSEETAPDKE
jgi:hypothetical protein